MLCTLGFGNVGAAAAEPGEAAAEAATAQGSLAEAEERVQAKFKQFEQVLLRMAELTAATDPRRSALLRKVVAHSGDKLIAVQLERLVALLKEDRLGNAVANEQQVEKDLAGLLELMLSEQRGERLKDERARIKEQIRRLNELINRQQQIQGQTSGNGDPKKLAAGQGKLSEDTGKLGNEMQADEPKTDQPAAEPDQTGKPNDGETKPGDKEPGGEKPDENKPAEEKPDGKKPGGEKPADAEPGESKPSERKPGDSKPGESKPGDQSQQQPAERPSQPGQGQQQDQNQRGDQDQPTAPSQPAEPTARRRVQAARQKMDEARQKLDKAQREGAAGDQEQALRELELAKAKLEEILRQLREEEMERVLAMLEARFRKMLEMQIEVYEGTKLLDKVSAEDRDRNDEIEAARLSRKEAAIVVEVDNALSVLREDGSAVAFPEAVGQVREDMTDVVQRLSRAQVDEVTQAVEQDIITALEEMIESLEKAQKDAEQKQQRGMQQAGEAEDPPLIDGLSELKMIRALQMRVNRRTKRYAKLVEGEEGQADKQELIEALERLAEREERIFRTTRDIVVGKNK